MQLKDTMLFRQHAFINGEWLDADNGLNVLQQLIGLPPEAGTAGIAPI